jgi:parallel beta-helix repeat protein
MHIIKRFGKGQRVAIAAAAAVVLGAAGLAIFGAGKTARCASHEADGDQAALIQVDCTASVPWTTTTARPVCRGVRMTKGQADIDREPAGTTFCLSGTHNWSLDPKNDDVFQGPATLDGSGSTFAAFTGAGTNVTIENLTISHYNGSDQQGAINEDSTATGLRLLNLDVGFNSHVGADLPPGTLVKGGRYHHNGQEGLGGRVGDGVTVDGVEIDHNRTDKTISCGYEGGGFKWVANNVTVRNSKIHDNSCKGLWSDINSKGMLIENNQIYNNTDEGIFIEISSEAIIRNNTVWGNGLADHSGCQWLWGGGITVAASDHVEVYGNTLRGNCNGITGIQQSRPDGNPGLLDFFNVHDNSVAGPVGVDHTGVAADNGADLSTRSIAFTHNTYANGMVFCGLKC